MNLNERLKCLQFLEQYIRIGSIELDEKIQESFSHNPWFTPENINNALGSIVKQYLAEDLLQEWINGYQIPIESKKANIGLVLAGNIPLVGFHDLLCCFIAGHCAKIKLSEKDRVLLPFLIQKTQDAFPEASEYFQFVDRLTDFDAVIATGSNNTAVHFEYYFRNYPHIIRRNRNAVAVLWGDETDSDYNELGKDVFSYFGLGCRNISKIYVPEDFDLSPILKSFMSFEELIHHHKYRNNYDYTNALFLLNKDPFLTNGCILFKEDQRIASRISCIHYEYYSNEKQLGQMLKKAESEIQCIVSQRMIDGFKTFELGMAQKPGLFDYADDVDTLLFFLQLDLK